MAVKILLEARDVEVYSGSDADPNKPHWPLRTAWITCPCGKTQPVFLTRGGHFALNERINAWHYETQGDRITISPSIGLNSIAGHTDACHLSITNAPFEWQPAGIVAS